MIRVFFFDFNQTLVQCPQWMDLEIRTFPRAALLALADQGLIEPPSQADVRRAEATFRARRRAADRSGRESSHLQDLKAILGALSRRDSVPDPQLQATIEGLHRACLPFVRPMAGALQAVPALHHQGYRLGIVSNAAFSPFIDWALDQLGLFDLFEDILVSADVGIRKPRREMFQLALQRMGVAAHEAAHVGDDLEKDVHTAKRLGMRAIWLRPDRDPAAPDQALPPDAIVTSLEVVPAWATAQRE